VTEEVCDRGVGGDREAAERTHRAFNAGACEKYRKIGDVIDPLKAVIGHQSEIIICGRCAKHIAEELISPLKYGVCVLSERTLVVFFRIEVDEVDQDEIRLLFLKKVEDGESTGTIVHPLLRERRVHVGDRINETGSGFGGNGPEVHGAPVAPMKVLGKVPGDGGIDGDWPGDRGGGEMVVGRAGEKRGNANERGGPVVVAAFRLRTAIALDAMLIGTDASDERGV